MILLASHTIPGVKMLSLCEKCSRVFLFNANFTSGKYYDILMWCYLKYFEHPQQCLIFCFSVMDDLGPSCGHRNLHLSKFHFLTSFLISEPRWTSDVRGLRTWWTCNTATSSASQKTTKWSKVFICTLYFHTLSSQKTTKWNTVFVLCHSNVLNFMSGTTCTMDSLGLSWATLPRTIRGKLLVTS